MTRPTSLAGATKAAEREAITAALHWARGNVRGAAKRLGISDDTLHRRIMSLGLRSVADGYSRAERQPGRKP